MRTDTPCPDEHELERFLLGDCADEQAAALEEHLAGCGRCAVRAEALRAEDDLIAAMRERSPILTADGGVLETLVERALQGVAQARHEAHLGEVGRLHGFRVERVLGEGGMGVVYLARDERARRLVAVKVLSIDSRMSPGRVERFRREAEMLARVRHPNVVQLYEVGERPAPYLVMEYVEGGTLAGRLAQGPLEPAEAAVCLEALARGAHAAHEQGVVHRDLKPANVLLFSGDSPNRAADTIPKITDFGLARALDGEQQTRTGAILGTPAYMAPEQAAGREPTPAADVYSLGAVLYEMLTGRPPFRGATPLETLEQARTLEPVSPRTLRPGVPRDLAVICLKCLEKEPARRYASAAALADDLRRHLDDRPIVARPASVAVRVVKWARRRPLVALLSALCLACLAALAAGGVLYERWLRAALDQAREERERAEERSGEATRQAERADANYREASEAVRRMLFRTKDARWNAIPRLQQLRRQQMEDALAFYDRMAAQQGDDPRVRHDVAWASLEASKLRMLLGRGQEAAPSIRRAIELTEPLLHERPRDVPLRLLRADALLRLGQVNEGDDALRSMERAASLLEGLVAERPDAPGARGQLADTHITLGAGYERRRRYAAGLRVMLRAVELSSALLAEAPGDDGLRLRLARARVNLAAVYRQLGQREKTLRQSAVAEAEFERLLARDPYNPETIDGLTALRVNGAYDLQTAGKLDEAVAFARRNVPLLEEALRREPEVAAFRYRLFATHGVTAMMLQAQGKRREAAVAYEQALPYADGDRRAVARLELVGLWLEAKDHARAAAEAARAEPELVRRAEAGRWKWAAELYDAMAEVAAGDSTLASDRREALAKQYRAAAAAARKQAKSLEKGNPEKTR